MAGLHSSEEIYDMHLTLVGIREEEIGTLTDVHKTSLVSNETPDSCEAKQHI